VAGRDGAVRFDLSYPSHRVVIEYDGRQHAESDEQWGGDIDRREWMDGFGFRLVVVRSKDVHRTPARTLRRIILAMRERGMVVPRVSEEWRLHFPSLPGDDPTAG
jgi:very-short-patch-repair endonuclease